MLQWDRGFQRAAPTALSGSRIKPPALPEVSDFAPQAFRICGLPAAPAGVLDPVERGRTQ